jgi:hypothetical protein
MTIKYFSNDQSDKVTALYRGKIKMISLVLVCFVVFLFSSCGVPVMRGGIIDKKKEYPPLEEDAHVAIYKKPQQIPIVYETLGKISLLCSYEFAKKDDTTKCNSTSVFRAAKSKAREIGGNAILITEYKEPTIPKSYYFLKGDVLKVFDFSSPPDLLYSKRIPNKSEIYGKGTWDLRLTIPYINHFILKPNGERDISKVGFLGAAIGFDYYHQNTQYLSVLAGVGIDFFLPFPVHLDYNYGEEIVEKEFCSSTFISLTNNHRYKFISLGYGLSYSHNSWILTYNTGYSFENNSYVAKKYTGNTLGLMFTGYWLTKKSFSLGVIYRPNFIRLNTTPTFKYEHLISIDLAWRIRLKTVAKHE